MSTPLDAHGGGTDAYRHRDEPTRIFLAGLSPCDLSAGFAVTYSLAEFTRPFFLRAMSPETSQRAP